MHDIVSEFNIVIFELRSAHLYAESELLLVTRQKKDSRGDERKGQGRKRKRNESEETEDKQTFPSTLHCYKDSRSCPTVSLYQLDTPVT